MACTAKKRGKSGVTTGAGSDLEQATNTARSMVTKYGMSSSLGPIYHNTSDLERLSSATREAVEIEVREILQRAENNARRILSDHKDELHRLAEGLLTRETLTLTEINELLATKGKKK